MQTGADANPDSADLNTKAGIAFYHTEQYKLAVVYLLRSLEVAPKSVDSLFYLAQSYMAQGQLIETVIEAFQRVIAISPDHLEANKELGRLFETQSRYVSAIEHYGRANQLSPTDIDLLLSLGKLYRSVSKFELALVMFQNALNLEPLRAEIYLLMGEVYYYRSDMAKATSAYRKAIEIEPDNDQAYHYLGVLQKSLGFHGQSLQSHQKSVEINPNNGVAHNNLAVAYFNAKQYDLAEQHSILANSLGQNMTSLLNRIRVVKD